MSITHAKYPDFLPDQVTFYAFDRDMKETWNLTPLINELDGRDYMNADADQMEWSTKAAQIIDDFIVEAMPGLRADGVDADTFADTLTALLHLKAAMQRIHIVEDAVYINT